MVDYLGPTVTKVAGLSKKVWLALITCLSTRAVYLEPVLDLSAGSFLHVFRRFASRRGTPKRLFSDNGTQFQLSAKVAAALEAGKSVATPLDGYLAREGIIWRFAPSLSPWSQGAVERIVGSTKSAFKRVLGARILPLDELITFTTEVESVLNQRPLTHVSDGLDCFLPLRPIDFLMPRVKLGI